MADIVALAVGAGCFQTLVAAVESAGLVDALKSPGPFTVFAPNDDAFAALPPGTVTTLVQNPPQLARILKYHVVAGRYTKADLRDGMRLPSLEGSLIPIFLQGEVFAVKHATVLTAPGDVDGGRRANAGGCDRAIGADITEFEGS